MAVKVYLKKGNLNYKERKFISALQKALDEKGISGKDFNPATNFGELEQLYNQYCVEDAQYVEVKDTKEVGSNASGNEESSEEQHKNFRDGMKQSVEAKEVDTEFDDPFNQGEVIVRDYVKDGGMKDPNEVQEQTKTTFEEPTDFKGSFEMPNHDDGKGDKKGGGLGKARSDKKEEKKSEPINPEFDNMTSAKKRKSTKKMARAIIEGVCKLAEFGSVWWVTKDITEDKVIEYEINDTIDVNILLSLDERTQITVKSWFAKQVKDANELLKIGEEEKEELIDSLYEVMLEKGIAPTPMQELIINAVSTIVIGLGVKAFAMQQQIKGVLNQLIIMRAEQKKGVEVEQNEDEHEHTHTHTETTTTTRTTTDTDSGDEHLNTNSNLGADTDYEEVEVIDDDKQNTDLTITN
jgi:hypothetical protein